MTRMTHKNVLVVYINGRIDKLYFIIKISNKNNCQHSKTRCKHIKGSKECNLLGHNTTCFVFCPQKHNKKPPQNNNRKAVKWCRQHTFKTGNETEKKTVQINNKKTVST